MFVVVVVVLVLSCDFLMEYLGLVDNVGNEDIADVDKEGMMM